MGITDILFFPLFKSGPRDIKNNYRPISVLSILSKVLEKHVAKSLMNHLTENGLLYNLQSAFREGHSTETALTKLTDQILFNMDQDQVTGMVFVDFRKAFYVVNHQILIKKVKLYRTGSSSLAWFESYLSERKQFVTIGSKNSSSLQVRHGVPQASYLVLSCFCSLLMISTSIAVIHQSIYLRMILPFLTTQTGKTLPVFLRRLNLT